MKKIIIIPLLISSYAYSADYVSIVTSDSVQYIGGLEVKYTEWVNSGSIHSCNDWSPNVETVPFRTVFVQNRECTQDQTRNKETYQVLSDGTRQLIQTEEMTQSITISDSQQNVGTFDDIIGDIINFRAQNDQSALDNSDVTKTNNPYWEEKFGKTYDIVINEVALINKEINKTGIIDWFNPNKQIQYSFGEGCWDGDFAHNDIEYLDENNNIVFWTKTRSFETYGSSFYYGKKADFSDSTLASHVGPYPAVHGFLDFDIENKTVNYSKHTDNNYINNWSLSNIDVDSIRKIRLSYTKVLATYTGGSCGAGVIVRVLDK